MYNPRIFKAAMCAIPATIVPLLSSALAATIFFRHYILATLLYMFSGCWVFMLAYYAGHEWVDTFWEDE